jgi:heme-degrading monooxygenase HmoA
MAMFLINEVLNFGMGRRQEALDRLAWIHGLMAPHEGFVRAIVAKYLGDGTRHTILRVWRDEDAYRTFRASPDGNYGRGRPEGLYVNDPVVPQWNSIEDADHIGAGPFLVKTQWEVPDDAWDAFIAANRRVEGLALKMGLKGVNEFRATDRSEGLTIGRFESRTAYEGLIEHPDFLAIRRDMPEGITRLSVACHEVVSDVLPE